MTEAAETDQPAANPPAPKKPIVSLPFLCIVGIVAVGAYFAGPHVMTWVMYQQEEAKKKIPYVPPDPATVGLNVGDGPFKTGPIGASMGGGGGGGGGRGGWDPEAFFAEQDADGNGKLEGDEISGRMAERLDAIDSDGDGAVTIEELMASRANRGGGERGGRPASESEDATPQYEIPTETESQSAEAAPTGGN